MTFKFVIIDGKERIERTIEEIVEVGDKTLISLGVTSGMDLEHCFNIASRYCNTTDDFLNDVKYYRVCSRNETLNPECATTIIFYK